MFFQFAPGSGTVAPFAFWKKSVEVQLNEPTKLVESYRLEGGCVLCICPCILDLLKVAVLRSVFDETGSQKVVGPVFLDKTSRFYILVLLMEEIRLSSWGL